MQRCDVVILGAGAAGLYAAAVAARRGLRVVLIDHAAKVAEKIRISGGGRCNVTNRDVDASHFFGENPDFARSALARHGSADVLRWLARHRIGVHEKHKGQLFCDDGAGRVIAALLADTEGAGVRRWQPCAVVAVRHGAAGFELDTAHGTVGAPQLVVATGGLSIPALGATDLGHRLARQFGHRVVAPRPALVPLTLPPVQRARLAALAGVAAPVRIALQRATPNEASRRARKPPSFDDDLLVTHRGLSGPAALQISTPWQPGDAVTIDFAPSVDLRQAWRDERQGNRRSLATWLAQRLPARLADALVAAAGLDGATRLADLDQAAIASLAAQVHDSVWQPDGTEGFRKAEVTAGGVDTAQLSSTTLESRRVPGLHFVGEVVDVTGWLGGYNFQWAWSSAHACASALRASEVG